MESQPWLQSNVEHPVDTCCIEPTLELTIGLDMAATVAEGNSFTHGTRISAISITVIKL